MFEYKSQKQKVRKGAKPINKRKIKPAGSHKSLRNYASYAQQNRMRLDSTVLRKNTEHRPVSVEERAREIEEELHEEEEESMISREEEEEEQTVRNTLVSASNFEEAEFLMRADSDAASTSQLVGRYGMAVNPLAQDLGKGLRQVESAGEVRSVEEKEKLNSLQFLNFVQRLPI